MITNPLAIAFDFGMLVLIWIVQLIIYPGFKRVEADHFRAWHKRYTFRISFVVIPLMFGQLGLSITVALSSAHPADYLLLTLVLTAWFVTFRVSVPLHRKLEQDGKDLKTIRRLVVTNWYRTALWTAVFSLRLYPSF